MAVLLAGSYPSSSTDRLPLPAHSSGTWYQNTTTSTSVFTANVDDTIVVKVATGQPVTTVTGVSNAYSGGSTKGVVDDWTLAAYETAGSGVAPIWIYVGTVVTAGAFNVSVSATTTSSADQAGNFLVERYTGVVPPPSSWNVATNSTPDTSSPFTSSFTTTTDNAVVTWLAADWNGAVTSYSGFTYQSGAVATTQFINSQPGALDGYGAYQTVASAGTTTIGYSKSTTGQSITFAALELPSQATPPPPPPGAGPAIVRAATGAANATSTAFTIGETSGSPQAGDVRFIFGSFGGSGVTVTFPPGWTTLYNAIIGSGTLVVAYKAWVAGVGTETIRMNTSTYSSLELATVTGLDPSATPQLTTNGNATSSSTLTATGLTPNVNDGLLLAFFAQSVSSSANTGTLSTPAGLTLVDSRVPAATTGYPVKLCSEAITSKTATGNFVSTSNRSGSWRTAVVVIPSAVAPAPSSQFLPFF